MTIYTVSRGDTLQNICARFRVDAAQVIDINDLTAPNALAVGQALILPTDTHAYTVQAGDTIFNIANRMGVSTARIYADNPTLRDRTLMAGETILVPLPPTKWGTAEINGYAYPYIDAALLQKALPYLTYLTVFSYGVRRDGSLVQVEDDALIAAARSAGVAPILLLSTIGDDGKFNSDVARIVLEDEVLQHTLIDNLLAILADKGYEGVDVDFEYIPQNLAEEYAAFLTRLDSALSAAGLLLFVALAPKTSRTQRGLLYEAHDYRALGAAADRALIMTYEWGYTYGPPMAIAPIDQVRRVVQFAVTEIPPEKIMLGLPNYAYDWPLPFERGVTAATSLSNPEAAALAGEVGAEILFDEKAASPHYNYTAEGTAHEVWFEDARSVSAKLRLLQEYKLTGAGVWNIMRPFGQLWYLLDYYFNIRKINLS